MQVFLYFFWVIFLFLFFFYNFGFTDLYTLSKFLKHITHTSYCSIIWKKYLWVYFITLLLQLNTCIL